MSANVLGVFPEMVCLGLYLANHSDEYEPATHLLASPRLGRFCKVAKALEGPSDRHAPQAE